jgi:hypothetical protein
MGERQKWTQSISLGYTSGELRIDLEREEAIRLATEILAKVQKAAEKGFVTLRIPLRRGKEKKK